MSVPRLSDRVRRELTYLSYPSREWTIPRYRDGARVLDVLIVGGGQAGLAIAFGLKLERISNIRIVDRNPPGLEGPWRRFARMKALRTSKDVRGIDLGIPSLHPPCLVRGEIPSPSMGAHQSLYPRGMARISRLVPRRSELRVENEIEVTSIEPAGDLSSLVCVGKAGSNASMPERLSSQPGWKAAEAGGHLRPSSPTPSKLYANSTDDIDFDRLAGKRVGILGGGAAALDNAAAALEAGATRVDLCFRRAKFPTSIHSSGRISRACLVTSEN